MSQPIDFLAVGDITTDTFIRLKTASVQNENDPEHALICMPWGAKLPYESATEVVGVGNAANAAVSAARLGVKTGMFSWTGSDKDGMANKALLESEGVSTELLHQSETIPSNHDYVLWFGNERTILIKHSSFPYALPENLPTPKYVYLSSLGDPSCATHLALAEWVKSHPEAKLMFQPGQEIAFGREKLAQVYQAAYFVVCNKEESEKILGYEESKDIKQLLTEMHALGPQIVAITDGLNGAYAFDGESGAMYMVPLYPDIRGPYERTGAGDAFASSVAAALSLGLPLTTALMWGPINSMSVVQEIGAQKGLLTREALEKYLADAPADYVLETI
jgi:ribokinase